MSGLRGALRVREFAALLISYVINQVGDVVGSLALAVIVFGATHSALATAALFLATQFLPGLIGPPLISRVDRLAPGRLLPVLYAIEGGLFLLLALTVGRLGFAPIVALAFLDGILAFIARTMTRTAAASILIPHGLMPEGKAAFNVGLAVATIAGPGIAAVAIGVLGAPSALVADAVSFLLAAALLARVAPRRAVAEDDPADAPSGGRLRESFRYIAREGTLRALIARREPRLRVLLPRRAGGRRLRDEVSALRRQRLRRLARRLGSRDRHRLGRARSTGAPHRYADDPPLDPRRGRRLHRHRGGSDPAARLRGERRRRDRQRHPVGVGRDRDPPARRGSVPRPRRRRRSRHSRAWPPAWASCSAARWRRCSRRAPRMPWPASGWSRSSPSPRSAACRWALPPASRSRSPSSNSALSG